MRNNTTVWQVAAGESKWDCSDIFLDNDVMLVGWGGFGPYGSRRFRKAAKRPNNSSGIGTVTRFATAPRARDIVLLRSGHRAVGIGGLGRQGYSYDPAFGYVHGADMRHTQRVIWRHHLQAPLSRLQKRKDLFADCPRMSTFTQVRHPGILRRIKPLIVRCRGPGRRLGQIGGTQGMSMSELKRALCARGFPRDRATAVCRTVRESRELIRFYERGFDTSEHEIVAHIVLPLLRALGWENKRLGVEWQNMDVVGFDRATWKSPLMVCEAKHLYRNLEGVIRQPMQYCGRRQLFLRCARILVTNGRWFYLYKRYRRHGRWVPRLLGRLDLENIGARPSPSSPLTAIDVLLKLAPTT